MPNDRLARRHEGAAPDQRSPFHRDRDRILYSSAFRRLDGITQVVRAGEADVFHNRLTHSIKVAQVGRRLAEHCLESACSKPEDALLHPEVIEAACLGHDLGHPPFGHVGEWTLNTILTDSKNGEPLDREGFEGNAQSFRIVTKLAVRFVQCQGLDLTAATLAALQKYPWVRDVSQTPHPDRTSKWGYYVSEQDDADFCRQGLNEGQRTLEAKVMDWADDIAYSVHDLEDFHRCNDIPWMRIFGESTPDLEPIVDSSVRAWHNAPTDAGGRLRNAHRRLQGTFNGFAEQILYSKYEGYESQRVALRILTSQLIGRFIRTTKIEKSDSTDVFDIKIDRNSDDEVRFLKQIARRYIIDNPSLAAQQIGQQRVIKELFSDFIDEIKAGEPRALPRRFHELIARSNDSAARLAADCISSLTEREAIAMHQRLNGSFSGSVLDPIVR